MKKRNTKLGRTHTMHRTSDSAAPSGNYCFAAKRDHVPPRADSLIRLANTVCKESRIDARVCLRKVLQVSLRDAAALGDETPASALFRIALNVLLGLEVARFKLSMQLLVVGDFATGWRDYETRWQVRQYCRRRQARAQSKWRDDLRGSRAYGTTETRIDRSCSHERSE